MKARLFAVALFVLVSWSSAAYAQYRTVTVEYENFTLDYLTERGTAEMPDLKLLSDSNGVTVFDLPYVSGVSLADGHLEWYLSTRFRAQPGYQIVGYEIAGSVTGMVWAEQPPDSPDVYRVILPDPQNSVGIGRTYFQDINGPREFLFSSRGLIATSDYDYFDFNIYGAAIAHRGSYLLTGDPETHRLEADSSLEFQQFQFTVFTALIPVPEPDAWMMLVIGLVPVVWVMRGKSRGQSHRDSPRAA